MKTNMPNHVNQMQNLPVIFENGFDLTISKLVGLSFSLSNTDVVLHKGLNKMGGIWEMRQGCYFSPENIETQIQQALWIFF